MRLLQKSIVAVLLMPFTLAALTALLAGPQQNQPLLFKQAPTFTDTPPNAENQAFYYANGEKVYLHDTGLGVAKLKEKVSPDTLPAPKVHLAPDSSLAQMRPTLEKEGYIIVSTRGPRSLNLYSAQDAHRDKLEYVMPIVNASRTPQTAAPENAMPMVLLPRISARFTSGMTEEQVKAYINMFGLHVQRKLEIPNGYLLELQQKNATFDLVLKAANQLYEQGSKDKKIVYSQPSFLPAKKKYGDIIDPRFSNQWHLNNGGSRNGVKGADIRAVEAWKITEGSPDVIIGIIDDSVDKDHPDLAPNFKAGRYYNGLSGQVSDDPSPRDGSQMHGTCCAGVAVAAANDIGGRGSAPRCKLVAVNFSAATTEQTAEAFYFCDRKGVSVISCSWGWNFAFDDVSRAINDLSQNGRNGRGTVILFAAGNDYGLVSQNNRLAALSSVICIGASNWRDDHSPYANHGPEVAVVAPSNDIDTPGALSIDTTDNRDSLPRLEGRNFSGYAPGEYTGIGSTGFGGTSSATPLTAGVCGLILSVNPNLTRDKVREILIKSADKIPGELTRANYSALDGHDAYYGYGRVNAKKAVEMARATVTIIADR